MVYHPKNGEYKYAPKINHAIPQTNSSIFFEHATYFIHNLALTITLVFSAFVFFQKKKALEDNSRGLSKFQLMRKMGLEPTQAQCLQDP